MDLAYINECAIESSDAVYEILDKMYLKQQMILEYDESLDLSKYQCFQEGFMKPKSKELDVFKFDNSHILKAIKYFNDAYKKIPFDVDPNYDKIKSEQERGKLNIGKQEAPHLYFSKRVIDEAEKVFKDINGPFEKGFQELQKQFECLFNIYIVRGDGTGTALEPFSDSGKLTISKKKGFQLGGLKIFIQIDIEQLLDLAPANHKLFGQMFTSIMLHEIYHNIVHMVGIRNKRLHDDIKSTIKDVGSMKNQVSITAKLSSFVERFTSMFSIKRNEIKKDKAINRLYILSQIQDNINAVKQFEEDIKHDKDPNNDKEIEKYIHDLQTISRGYFIIKMGRIVSAACSILLAAIGFVSGSAIAAITGTVCLAVMSLGMIMKKVSSLLGLNEHTQEEYFCDLFAAMYKLPVHLTSFNRQISLNKNNSNKMTDIRKLDQKISKNVNDPHPITFDREVTSYELAKQLLSSKVKLKKDIKEYLQYIVDLHEGIDEIDNPYSKRQAKKLDPEAAADLRKTMKDFVSKTGVTVTESYIDDLCNITGGEYYVFG